jgi:hypothetical protein
MSGERDQMSTMQQLPLPIHSQKSMAFEGLLAWAKAIVSQADRVANAQEQFKNKMAGFSRREPGVVFSAEPIRNAGHVFKVERHLFCNTAGNFFDHRRWLKRLGGFDESVFAEMDLFERDVRAMRNLNEHAIEYFEGKGQRPEDWMFRTDDFNSDPTGTVNTLIGGRLDWIKLREATARLLESLPAMFSTSTRH